MDFFFNHINVAFSEFVQNLTAALHSELPGARVIWYDSVRVDGKLHWQNELNEYNK